MGMNFCLIKVQTANLFLLDGQLLTMHKLAYIPCSNLVIISVPYHCPSRDLQRKLSLMEQGVTIFTITLMILNAKNSQPSGDWTPGNVQSRYVPQEPHTSWDGIPFCILRYLNISDFSWLKVYVLSHAELHRCMTIRIPSLIYLYKCLATHLIKRVKNHDSEIIWSNCNFFKWSCRSGRWAFVSLPNTTVKR